MRQGSSNSTSDCGSSFLSAASCPQGVYIHARNSRIPRSASASAARATFARLRCSACGTNTPSRRRRHHCTPSTATAASASASMRRKSAAAAVNMPCAAVPLCRPCARHSARCKGAASASRPLGANAASLLSCSCSGELTCDPPAHSRAAMTSMEAAAGLYTTTARAVSLLPCKQRKPNNTCAWPARVRARFV